MADYTTKSGRTLTETELDALVAEAERGYDVAHAGGCCDPVGPSDIAARSGYPAATVNRWVARGLLPAPPHHVSGGAAWPWAMARRWLIESGRCYVDDQGKLQRVKRTLVRP
jgi:hypothetical protein